MGCSLVKLCSNLHGIGGDILDSKICEICPIKDTQSRNALLRRVNRIASLEAFLEGLARNVPLDWGRIADTLKAEIGLKHTAAGLNVVNKIALIMAIDHEIHMEMENQRQGRNV